MIMEKTKSTKIFSLLFTLFIGYRLVSGYITEAKAADYQLGFGVYAIIIAGIVMILLFLRSDIKGVIEAFKKRKESGDENQQGKNTAIKMLNGFTIVFWCGYLFLNYSLDIPITVQYILLAVLMGMVILLILMAMRYKDDDNTAIKRKNILYGVATYSLLIIWSVVDLFFFH